MAEDVRAELPAKVWRVSVAVGDAVAEGDTVVILESMKMEIPVLAESAGTVDSVAVAEGDDVQPGALLVVLS
ncbi:biotin/lipoyl-binding carrier protein [Rhodococcus antarcticus]|jgi:acetyl-CoA carboxylase biotin carboxyl carrier protein|uniref:Biotin/lipoyl-binding carrier protein n=1 Tax=Rhodococcus antarcticus TaxID=2987751 RepID=A0ABY6P1N4_9NOCA|nr:biotin/lipoyl-binding carrier protein [Rhodococcus antarcticus]UZJ25570.1 biotin/lipoyl-binding carrier protein [Rhodococcus antarcticus]